MVSLSHDSAPIVGCRLWGVKHLTADFHAVSINPFPIGRFHGLFLPYFWRNLSQTLTYDALLVCHFHLFWLTSQKDNAFFLIQLGLHFVTTFESSDFRLGFNSIGAYASVNHLHFQFWELHNASFSVESAPREAIADVEGVVIERLNGDVYPMRGFVFSLNMDVCFFGRVDRAHNRRLKKFGVVSQGVEHELESLAKFAWSCLELIIAKNIPYSMTITPDGRLFLLPRGPQRPITFETTPGFPDVSGFHVVTRREIWDRLTADEIWDEVRNRIAVSADVFGELENECFSSEF